VSVERRENSIRQIGEGWGTRQHCAMCIQDRHRPLEQVGQCQDDLAKPAAAQDNGREPLVDCC